MARDLDRYLLGGLILLTGAFALAQAWQLAAVSGMFLLAVVAHRARM